MTCLMNKNSGLVLVIIVFILYTCTVSKAVIPVSVPCVHLYSHKLNLQSVYLMNISDKPKMKMIESFVREFEDKFQIR